VKQVLRLSFLLAFVCSAATAALAQTPTPTPDPFVAQITSTASDNFARDIDGRGRFVVIESAGDLSTVNSPGQTAETKSPNNADGNREIFLFDYAQRRIFQLTDTRHVLNDAALTGAARFANANIAVEVTNNRPMISRDGKWVVFTSNGFDPADAASTPFQFYGDTAAAAVQTRLKGDGNQEIFLYSLPEVAAVADLSGGDNLPLQDLRRNAFTRVTNTPASRLPRPGTATTAPFTADDNRDVQPNDRASRLVFISTRDLTPTAARRNPDATPEVFSYNRGDGSFVQITDTSFAANPLVFASSPNISGDTTSDVGGENPASVVAFYSNANIPDTGQSAGANPDGNGEIYVAQINATTVTSMKQATRTRRVTSTDFVSVLNPGRRLSRDGTRVAFESTSVSPGADAATNEASRALFVYNIPENNFTQIGPRAVSDEAEDVLRFPTFTGDSARLVWVSTLNLTPAGGRVAAADAAGLNPTRTKQIFTAALPAPAAAVTSVTRLTNITGIDPFNTLQPFVSNTIERITFSLAVIQLGGGNADLANEVYYLVTPPATGSSATAPALSFLTGASRREVVTPTASPTPTPTATTVTGLAPGMIGVVRRTAETTTLADAARGVCPAATPNCDAASESRRRPPLPFELGGVSLSINGAAAGLYFVSPEEIQFVVPAGLAAQTGTSTYPVVINIRAGGTGAVRTVRGVLQIVAAQPDLFSTTNGPGGRAVITNVTNPLLAMGTGEPFTVTTTYVNSATPPATVTEATLLRQVLTGVRGVPRAGITVRLVRISDNTTTDITGDAIPRDPQPTDTPGVFTLDFRLPAALANAGDVAIIVTVNAGAASSRPADTAPRFRIAP
jgi:uncharacterized protein (TIGR03437 family)